MLRIALEPEAASLFCQHLPLEKLFGASKGFDVSKPGTKYMVIDLGGKYIKLPHKISKCCEIDISFYA